MFSFIYPVFTFVIIVQILTAFKMKQIDDWRDIGLSKELIRTSRVRTLGANSLVTGFGNEYEVLGSNGTLLHSG